MLDDVSAGVLLRMLSLTVSSNEELCSGERAIISLTAQQLESWNEVEVIGAALKNSAHRSRANETSFVSSCLHS